MAASSPSRLCFTFLLLFQVTLKLIETFVDKSEDLNRVAIHTQPCIMHAQTVGPLAIDPTGTFQLDNLCIVAGDLKAD